MNKLKKKALRVIAEHLSEKEAADIKDMFDKMYVNNNDKLTFDDFKAGIRKLGNQMLDSNIKILMDDVGTAVVSRQDGRLALGRVGALCEQGKEVVKKIVGANLDEVKKMADASAESFRATTTDIVVE
ncbi:hypothetical protein ABZP36_035264 [Zizania latifolia]